MGCDAITGMKEDHATSDRDRRLASLISLMLSSQTKDPGEPALESEGSMAYANFTVTHEATMNLKRSLQGGLCLEGLLAASEAEIQVISAIDVLKAELRARFGRRAYVKSASGDARQSTYVERPRFFVTSSMGMSRKQ